MIATVSFRSRLSRENDNFMLRHEFRKSAKVRYEAQYANLDWDIQVFLVYPYNMPFGMEAISRCVYSLFG
jgi:hypothetical protein